MARSRFLASSVLVLALLGGISCSTDGPTGIPAANQQPSASIISDLGGVVGGVVGGVTQTVSNTLQLLTCSSQPYATASRTIGRDGGVLQFGTNVLVVPPGALSGPVTITGEQIRGTVNSVRFSPEGLAFAQPAALTMTYRNCLLNNRSKRVVYTDENLSILEQLRSFDETRTKTVTGEIKHFSRYAVAW